ncbi:hypothetical protein D3C84_478530 [compost metagenome]
MDVRQVELRTDRQFFDHELEVVVAGQRHHGARGVGLDHAEGRRNGPAERAGLAAVDPVARLVDMQELRAGDLRQTDGADVAGVLAEELVHFFIDALRLDRHVVEVGLALQGALALAAGFDPGAAVLQLAGGLPLAGHFDEGIQRRTGVGDDAQVRVEYAADLGRLDVDVDELAALGVDVDAAGVAVGPAVADTEHQVGFQQGGVAVAVRGLQTDHADHQLVVVGNRAPAHQGRNHRHAGQFGELDQLVRRVGVEDAATGDQQRALGFIEHGQGFLGLHAVGGGLGQRQRLVGVDIEFYLGHLHVERQIDQHRTRTAAAHFIEGLLEGTWHLARLHDGGRPLGHRPDDAGDVDGLEVLLVHARPRRLPGDAEDRDGVGAGRVQAGDHVGAGRAGGADAHADVAGVGAGVALGHVRGAFDVASQDVVDTTDFLQCGVQRVDGGAGDAERGVNAFAAHHQYGGLDCSHFGHCLVPLLLSNCIQNCWR